MHRKSVYREGGTPHIFSEQGANRGGTPHILSEQGANRGWDTAHPNRLPVVTDKTPNWLPVRFEICRVFSSGIRLRWSGGRVAGLDR